MPRSRRASSVPALLTDANPIDQVRGERSRVRVRAAAPRAGTSRKADLLMMASLSNGMREKVMKELGDRACLAFMNS